MDTHILLRVRRQCATCNIYAQVPRRDACRDVLDHLEHEETFSSSVDVVEQALCKPETEVRHATSLTR